MGYIHTIHGTPGLVAHWRLDEPSGTVAEDAYAANDGTYENAPTFSATGAVVSETWSKAVSFDGAQSEGVTIDSTNLRPGTGAFSIEFWIKRNGNPSNYEYPISLGAGGGAASWAAFIEAGTSNLYFQYGAQSNLVSGLMNNAFHHIVLSASRSSAANIFVDGASATTITADSSDINTTDPLTFAHRTPASPYWFTGMLDEVAYYNVALPLATATAHYLAGVTPQTPATESLHVAHGPAVTGRY